MEWRNDHISNPTVQMTISQMRIDWYICCVTFSHLKWDSCHAQCVHVPNPFLIAFAVCSYLISFHLINNLKFDINGSFDYTQRTAAFRNAIALLNDAHTFAIDTQSIIQFWNCVRLQMALPCHLLNKCTPINFIMLERFQSSWKIPFELIQFQKFSSFDIPFSFPYPFYF